MSPIDRITPIPAGIAHVFVNPANAAPYLS